MPERPAAVGLRLIITYKVVKAIVQATLAATLPALTRAGVTADLAAWATFLAEHLVHGWARAFARLLAAVLAPSHLTLIALALGLDAGLSAFEAWALHRRFLWAPWLVVIAGAALLPFELFELARRVRVGRVVALLLNVLIVGYLARRALRERRLHMAGLPTEDHN
jgi:uncharacterized membrane protein (DUF2068 family)